MTSGGRPPGVDYASTPRWVRIASIPVMVIAGALTSVQALINGTFRAELGTGMRAAGVAATVSMLGGLVTILIIAASIPTARRGVITLARAIRSGSYPWWTFVGGCVGGVFVLSQALSVSVIGVALFAVAAVAGQTTAALLVDRTSLAPGGPQPLSPGRVVAAGSAVAAVLIASLGGVATGPDATWEVVLLVLLPFLGGAGNAFQQAVNGRVARIAGPVPSTVLNVTLATTVVVVFLAVSLIAPGDDLGAWPTQWWMYLAGLIGITFIFLAAALVHVHGVLTLALLTIAGQVIAAEVLNALTPGGSITVASAAATLLVVVGVTVALVTARRRSRGK
jgi:transporter family-2 protein